MNLNDLKRSAVKVAFAKNKKKTFAKELVNLIVLKGLKK